MGQTITAVRHVRRPVADTSAFITDPAALLPRMTTLSRCRFVKAVEDGELWDVFLDSGAVHLGGRVLIPPPDGNRLEWRSVRGTRHSFTVLAEPDGPEAAGSKLTVSLQFKVTGLGVAYLVEMIGRGWVARNLEAIVEEIRHHLEFEK